MSLVVAVAVTAACAPAPRNNSQAGAIASPSQCARDKITTKTPGKLTIGVERPPLEPWFIATDPTNKKGFESALAYAIAEKLGFADNEVVWLDQVFADVVTPIPKQWDFDINEFTITPERAQMVDFSEPYYFNYQAMLVMDATINAKKLRPTLDQVRGLKIGAQADTTSYKTALAVEPKTAPSAFDSHENVVAALRNGQVEAMVTDLPTALLLMTAKIPNSQVLAKFVIGEDKVEQRERFGAVLEKGSPMLPCINWAIKSLWDNKKIEQLQEEWLKDFTTLPKIPLAKVG